MDNIEMAKRLQGKRILVTGASGFIGSFIVEKALEMEMEVWAAVRKTSSKRWLTNPRINFIELNLADKEAMKRQFAEQRFDYIVHAAGVTKCINAADFFRINTEGTKNLVRAIIEAETPITRFVEISSLSVFGPVREEQPYKEIEETDTPQPNTAYGRSKLEAERFLDSLEGFPYVVLRPTGVYGPRERDYFMMAQSIQKHTDFAVGFKRQDITFVYVADVVQAIFLALDHGKAGRKYFLSDGSVYNSRAFSDLIRKELGNPWLLRIKAPIWLLRVITFFGEHIGRITGKVTALNNDKFYIMRQRNWRCDIKPAMDELGYKPQYGLEQGVKLAIKWYKENGWL